MSYDGDRKFTKKIISEMLREYAHKASNYSCEDIDLEINNTTKRWAKELQSYEDTKNNTITFIISELANFLADNEEKDANGEI